MLLYYYPLQGQTVQLKSAKNNNNIQSAKKVQFDSEKIVLENITINCTEIEFTNKVKKLRIIGDVKLICTDVKFMGDDFIEILTNEGTLLIEYSGKYEEKKGFLINKSSGVTLTFKKI